MKLKTILIAAITGIFIPLNSAIASSGRYEYGYWWGSINTVCGLYKINAISEDDARMALNATLESGEESIKDPTYRNLFLKLVRTSKSFKESGCLRLINY